jgi:hypothetical protein
MLDQEKMKELRKKKKGLEDGEVFRKDSEQKQEEKRQQLLFEKERDINMMKDAIRLAEKREQDYFEGVRKRNDQI